MKKHYAGVDVGAAMTKAVIIDESGAVLGSFMTKSGADYAAAAMLCLNKSLEEAGLARADIARMMSTGYGRTNVPDANAAKTEITCQARGCYFHFPRAITIIDIGGQDAKVIKLDDDGRRIEFIMNRKCAAGTGAFLEEVTYRLNVPLEELDEIARRSTSPAEIGAYCTVFTSTEILARLREGVKLEDLLRGVFGSVVKRVREMTALGGDIVLAGGVVAHNPTLVEMLKDEFGSVFLPPEPQLTCALGAALLAAKI